MNAVGRLQCTGQLNSGKTTLPRQRREKVEKDAKSMQHEDSNTSLLRSGLRGALGKAASIALFMLATYYSPIAVLYVAR